MRRGTLNLISTRTTKKIKTFKFQQLLPLLKILLIKFRRDFKQEKVSNYTLELDQINSEMEEYKITEIHNQEDEINAKTEFTLTILRKRLQEVK